MRTLMVMDGLMLHQIGQLTTGDADAFLMTLPNGETVTVMVSATILLETILTNVLANMEPLPSTG